MYALKFDTLKFAQRLRDEVKSSPEQTEKAMAVFTETIVVGFTEWQEQPQPATKADLTAMEHKLTLAIAALDNRLAVAVEETKATFASTRADIAASKTETIRWMAGLVIGLAAFLYSVLKLHG